MEILFFSNFRSSVFSITSSSYFSHLTALCSLIMCPFRSTWFSLRENAPAAVADIYNLGSSSLPLEEHKTTFGPPNGQFDEHAGFDNPLDVDLIDGFGIVDHDYKQLIHDEATVTIPGDSERAPNVEGIALNSYVDPCNKKLSHNAHERNRRRKQNALYAQLQALLPNPDAEKKLSIPKTVCRTLKYIPELRNEITKLHRQRDKLLLIKRICERAVVASKSKASREHSHSHDGFLCFPPNVTVNFGASEHGEVLLTIYTCRAAPVQSSLLVLIEKEGLEVMDASTFVSRHTICSILRVQMIKNKVDIVVLQKKILSLCENSLAIEFLKPRLRNCHQMQHRLAGRLIS